MRRAYICDDRSWPVDDVKDVLTLVSGDSSVCGIIYVQFLGIKVCSTASRRRAVTCYTSTKNSHRTKSLDSLRKISFNDNPNETAAGS